MKGHGIRREVRGLFVFTRVCLPSPDCWPSFVVLRATTERLNSLLKTSCDSCVLKGPGLLPSRNSGKHDGLLAAEWRASPGSCLKQTLKSTYGACNQQGCSCRSQAGEITTDQKALGPRSRFQKKMQ